MFHRKLTLLVEAIQSRCAILRYTKLSEAEILKRLKEIAEAEGVLFLFFTFF